MSLSFFDLNNSFYNLDLLLKIIFSLYETSGKCIMANIFVFFDVVFVLISLISPYRFY